MAFSRKLLNKWKVVDPIGDTTVISPWLWFRKGFFDPPSLGMKLGKTPTSSASSFCVQDRIICDLKVNNAAIRSWSTISKFWFPANHYISSTTNHQFPEIKSFLVEFPYWSTFGGKVQWHYQNWKIPSTRMIAILKKKQEIHCFPTENILSFLLGIFFGWLTPNFEAHHLRPRNLQGNQNQFWTNLNLPRIDALPR